MFYCTVEKKQRLIVSEKYCNDIGIFPKRIRFKLAVFLCAGLLGDEEARLPPILLPVQR